MTVTNQASVQESSRPSASGQSLEGKTLAAAIDQALKSERFCEPERSLIVQIVCNAVLALPHSQLASTDLERLHV